MTGRAREYIHSLAFGLTGVGTALLGATLPATLHDWNLSDSRGGLLLLAAWGGSTTGALLVRGMAGYSPAIGLALSAGAMFALSRPHPPLLEWLYLIYGIGLGMAMTAISLMRSREVTASEADIELNRLNLVWAIGACFAPALAFQSLHLLSVAGVFRVMSLVLAAAALLLLVSALRSPGQVGRSAPRIAPQAWAPLRFCLFAAAAVGLESAVGSWLTTYTQRVTHGIGTAVSANSAFWAGLLLSRAAHSLHSARWFHTRAARLGHLALVGVATLLFFAPSGALLPVAGMLSGLGLGPLYPFVLSVSLPHYRSNAVFVMAGVGASLVPWLTGTLSTASGSLRTGLLVPAAAFGVLMLAAWRMGDELSTTSDVLPDQVLS